MPDPWPVSGETFHLPQLQRLYISDSKPLPNFQVPVLEQLTLGMGAQRHGTSQRHRQPVTRGLDGFIANTPTIRKLGFMGGTDQHFVLTILKKFPHIEELAVIVKWTWEDTRVDSDGDESGGDSDGESGGHGHGDGDWDPDQATRIFISSLFRPFFNNPRDTPLCPRLARIHLGIADDGSQAILSACLKMLESRWNLPDHGALEAATIVQSGVASPNGEMQNRIDALRAEGLQLAVSNEGTQVMRTMASWMCTTEWEEHKVPFREFEDMY
ncbi:hypothetical protein FB45DRAFT_947227 [Roridomyces roridus]|uniref:Uncharacterized protein n=1 Tax=Roridomyces roridus TaxID=1738132 RepID=A0AAD7B2Y7_9AGAR|nr:hypothetical protein FB45DRAFT_947227 [Roridomyces roridus]